MTVFTSLNTWEQIIKTFPISQFETIKAQCSDVESDVTLDEASTQQADLKQKISTLKAKIKEAQKKLNVHNKKVQDLSTKKNKLKEECLNLQKKVRQNKWIFILKLKCPDGLPPRLKVMLWFQ